MRICVIGAGYVGLVTAAVFADLGNEVIGLDVDARKVAALQQGRSPIFEPGLQEMIERNLEEGRLCFTTSYEEAIPPANIIFICVDTPPGPGGSADLSRVEAAARGIARHLTGNQLVVNKSTVPVGTGDIVRQIIEEICPADLTFEVVSNPEFLREGSAIFDSMNPDRIVIGCRNHTVAVKLLELYAPLERPMLITDVCSAELIKHASNSFLAMKISYVNCIADLCEEVGADVTQVVKGMGADARIGSQFLSPGIGYGGSCFPKDTEALASTAASYGYDFHLLKAAIKVNQERIAHFLGRLEERLGPLSGKTIAVLGLSFKPNTDDIRESKAIELIRELLVKGAAVRAYDPVATENARRVLPEVVYCDNAYEASRGADALVMATEWNEFKQLNLERLRGLLKRPLLFDGRNIYAAERMADSGFEYVRVGRKSAEPPARP